MKYYNDLFYLLYLFNEKTCQRKSVSGVMMPTSEYKPFPGFLSTIIHFLKLKIISEEIPSMNMVQRNLMHTLLAHFCFFSSTAAL